MKEHEHYWEVGWYRFRNGDYKQGLICKSCEAVLSLDSLSNFLSLVGDDFSDYLNMISEKDLWVDKR